jgi:hypothetical protein
MFFKEIKPLAITTRASDLAIRLILNPETWLGPGFEIPEDFPPDGIVFYNAFINFARRGFELRLQHRRYFGPVRTYRRDMS